jgi:hypothetical protein
MLGFGHDRKAGEILKGRSPWNAWKIIKKNEMKNGQINSWWRGGVIEMAFIVHVNIRWQQKSLPTNNFS